MNATKIQQTQASEREVDEGDSEYLVGKDEPDEDESEQTEFQHEPLKHKLRHLSFDGRMLRNRSHQVEYGITPYHQYLRDHQHYSYHHRHGLHSYLPSYEEYRASVSSHSSKFSLENDDDDNKVKFSTSTPKAPVNQVNSGNTSGLPPQKQYGSSTHRLDAAPFFTTVSNDSITSLFRRITSSPGNHSSKSLPLEEESHKKLKEEYRTFSLDGRLLIRNQHQQNEGMDKKEKDLLQSKPSDYGAISSSQYAPHGLAQDPNSNELKAFIDKEDSKHDDLSNFDNDESKGQVNDFRMKLQSSGLQSNSPNAQSDFFFYFIYALVNTMMSVPSLYGYASVIFNHDVFQPYISTLSKLVIWSSAVHQMSFVIFSSIPFSIATVQDAGLLFLNCISRYIADMIISEDGTVEEILSTTIVALGIATTTLGLMLVLMGKFKCANAVSYLPLPVVGGYLAFIGYFCVIAGIGLCISKSMINGSILDDIKILSEKQSFTLAMPGIISGFVMMYIGRTAKSDMALPITMVAIPSLFYAILFISGHSLDDARRDQWVGAEIPPASISAVFELFDLNLVRWDLVFSTRCIVVWTSMVFVVSFSSCLDVAAISMDMGEALDVNQELTTVGISNCISGVFLGQTGSYIFSQTILTCRTGFHSRWTGFLCVVMFLYFVVSKVNLLEITPLFFLGSTLIFIGIDLLYEWIIEVAQKLNLSEYLVLIATFIAIQIVGINGGIVFGIIVAVVEYVVTTSQVPSLRRVLKRSRAVWEQQHRRFLQDTVYDSRNPKIITLEITETVFFGSSLLLFSQICDEIGFTTTSQELDEITMSSPRNHSGPRGKTNPKKRKPNKKLIVKQRPRYVVLEMSNVSNVDASAARSCFLQLAKMCSKNDIVLCAAGANSRVEWVLRSHDVTYSADEEDAIKGIMLNPLETISVDIPSGKLILFSNVNECLELCENQLIYEYQPNNLREPPLLGSTSAHDLMNLDDDDESIKIPLSKIFERILGMEESQDRDMLLSFDEGGGAKVVEQTLYVDQKLFARDEISDCFYVILRGTIRISRAPVSPGPRSSEGEASYVSVGQIFGYVDFALQRRRSFNAVCEVSGTIVAKISQATIDRLRSDYKDLHHIIDKVLLQASLIELANIDVS